jgi:DNA-binding CsgD family transcriptional regulator
VTSNSTPPSALANLQSVAEVVFEADSLEMLCKSLVLSNWGEALCLGAFIYLFDRRANLSFECGFGRHQDELENFMEQIEYEQFLVELGALTHVRAESDVADLVFLPITSKRMSLGVMGLVVRLPNQSCTIDDISRFMSKSIGFFVNNKLSSGRVELKSSALHTSPASLTSRQREILELLAKGLTNREIALHLLVSESTVRHETMRIYRFFNAESRTHAVALAKSSGYLDGRMDQASPFAKPTF